MRKLIATLILFITVQTVFGQETLSQEKVQIGVPYPVVDAGTKQYFTYKNLIVSVKVDGGKFFLQTFNTDKITLEKGSVFEDFPRGFRIENYIQLNENVSV